VFDKGNNSKENFKMIDDDNIHYVGGLVSSHFKSLIDEANKNFSPIKIDDEEVPAYRIRQEIWGNERTCVVTISSQLKEGQIRGIEQHLEKKYKTLQVLKQQLENPNKRRSYSADELKVKLLSIIKGQFIENILKFEVIQLKNNNHTFTYHIDSDAYDYLKNNILGRKIVVTNRHEWSSEEILLAYRGQSKVEYAFRNLKNPFHLAIRPQFHWTDQKIEVHFFICIIGYLLSIAAYNKARGRAGYKKNISNFFEELRTVRLACRTVKKGKNIIYQLEQIPKGLQRVATALGITNVTN
jgi:transposase